MDDEDKKTFHQAMRDVKPLVKSNRHRSEKQAQQPPEKPSFTEPMPIPHFSSSVTEVPVEAVLIFSRGGVQPKQLKQMQRGQVAPQAVLDLHHLTVEQAQQALVDLLHQAQAEQYRYVLIITGKGHHTPPGQLSLKSYLNSWLRELPEVLAFTSVCPKLGGTGALMVLVAKRR